MSKAIKPRCALARDGEVKAFASKALLSTLLILAAPSAGAQQISQARIALPSYGGGGATEAYFTIDLTSGRSARIDQLRREPDRVRTKRLETNLFQEIGRPANPAAQPGEILLLPIHKADGSTEAALFVESSTGYTAYFEDLGRNSRLGKIVTTIGRPFGSLANADLNFVLLGRRDGTGRTNGAYLYHGTTGKALYIDQLQEPKPDAPVSATADLPVSTGYISATSLTVDEKTVAFLIIDSGTGSLYYLEPTGRIDQLRHVPTDLKLFDSFAADKVNSAPRRFMPVALQNSDDTTARILIVDVGSGQLGLIDNPRSPRPVLRLLPQNLYTVIAGAIQDKPRHFEPIPANTSGGTQGVWIIDSLSGSVVYIQNPSDPAALRIRAVSVER